MIGKLMGRLESASVDGGVIIDVGGVGYIVRVPLGALTHLGGSSGDVSLFIHTVVREDAIDLYGFVLEEELAFFKQLMSVSGIGPKTAISILNVADVGTLKKSISRGDSVALTKVFGIGKKSAERIVVELKDKMHIEISVREEHVGDDTEVMEALIALGYSATEARAALKEIAGSGMVGVREKIQAALKALGSPVSRPGGRARA